MIIEKKKITDLKTPDYNPRTSVRDDKVFYKNLKQSIEKFGYIDPIIWNKRTGNVVGGNQRLEVLRDKGEKEIEVVVVDFEPDEERAANVALNKITGDWHEKKLAELLARLEQSRSELLGHTGFDKKCLQELQERINKNWIDEIDAHGFRDEVRKIAKTFDITFTFPKEEEENIKSYVRDHKEEIIQGIIEKACE